MKKIFSLDVVLVLVMSIVAYGYFYNGSDWNTNSRLSLVKAVVEQNRLEVNNYVGKDLQTKDLARLRGNYYSDKAIGSSLIGMVYYFPLYAISQLTGIPISTAIFKELLTFLVASLLCAFLAPFIYSYAKKVSNNPFLSLLVTAIICVGTPFYKYSTAYYGHTLAGLFLFTAFFIWFNIKEDEEIAPTKILISAYFLSYAVITEYPTAVLAACIGLYILYILWKRRSLFDYKIYLRLMIGAAIPVVLVMTYNMAAFHHPFKTGYGYEVLKTFAEGQSGGFMGIHPPNLVTLFYMTFHTTMGIFWQSPVLLLAVWGWVNMWKQARYRAELILSLALVLVYFLLMSGYYMWWGGAAFTPRSLIPVLPFFAIPLIFLAGKWQKALLGILAFISIAQMFIVTAASNHGIMAITENMLITSISTMFKQGSTLYNVYVPNFFIQAFMPNRGTEFFQLEGYASLIPFFLIELTLLAGFIATTKRNATIAPSL